MAVVKLAHALLAAVLVLQAAALSSVSEDVDHAKKAAVLISSDATVDTNHAKKAVSEAAPAHAVPAAAAAAHEAAPAHGAASAHGQPGYYSNSYVPSPPPQPQGSWVPPASHPQQQPPLQQQGAYGRTAYGQGPYVQSGGSGPYAQTYQTYPQMRRETGFASYRQYRPQQGNVVGPSGYTYGSSGMPGFPTPLPQRPDYGPPHNFNEAYLEADKVDEIIEDAEQQAGLPDTRYTTLEPYHFDDTDAKEENGWVASALFFAVILCVAAVAYSIYLHETREKAAHAAEAGHGATTEGHH